MSTQQSTLEGETHRCPKCGGTLTLTRRAVLTVTTESIRTGTDPHDGSDRLRYDGGWACQNPQCDYDKSAGTSGTRPAEARPKRTRRFSTVTTTPETAPPQLLCPTCDRPLVYRQTVISGVKPIERWDYFECRTCGAFVYRNRTRKLRPTP